MKFALETTFLHSTKKKESEREQSKGRGEREGEKDVPVREQHGYVHCREDENDVEPTVVVTSSGFLIVVQGGSSTVDESIVVFVFGI